MSKSIKPIFGEPKIGQEQFAENFEFICQRCNGTGIDPDYKEVNVILAAIDDIGRQCKKDSYAGEFGFEYTFMPYLQGADRNAPYCLSCDGMKKIDWVDRITEGYKKELMDRKNEIQKWFLYDVDQFLLYIKNGEVWCKSGKKVHFDLERNCWIEVNDFNENIDSLRAVYKWLHRFKEERYFDFDYYNDHPFDLEDLCWTFRTFPVDLLQALKTELIISQSVTIERLVEIKNDLDFFLYDIQGFDQLYVKGFSWLERPWGPKFTWENVLRKVNLPLKHLHLFESDKIKSKK